MENQMTRAGLDGPSVPIIVEPLKLPEVQPLPEPAPVPAPVPDDVPDGEPEKVPA
jgi:hypothetical protein